MAQGQQEGVRGGVRRGYAPAADGGGRARGGRPADRGVLARAGAMSAEQLSEAIGLGGSKVEFDPDLHPRDRLGKFRDVLSAVKPGESVTVKGAKVRVERTASGYRVKGDVR